MSGLYLPDANGSYPPGASKGAFGGQLGILLGEVPGILSVGEENNVDSTGLTLDFTGVEPFSFVIGYESAGGSVEGDFLFVVIQGSLGDTATPGVRRIIPKGKERVFTFEGSWARPSEIHIATDGSLPVTGTKVIWEAIR
jgi:hypothetical protein